MNPLPKRFLSRLSGLFLLLASLVSPAHARDIGVDVSHFQGETGMPQANWTQLAAEGRTFAYIKSTEGLNPPGNIDAAWPANVARAKAAGILPGVYHFVRPVIDLERGSGLTTSDLTDWVLAFVNEVGALKGAGAEPIVYTVGSYAVG